LSQTANEVALLISASKVHWKCNRLLRDGAAARCTGHWALSARMSLNQASTRTVDPQTRDKEQWPPNNSPNLNAIDISCLWSDIRSYFETFIRNPKQFLN